MAAVHGFTHLGYGPPFACSGRVVASAYTDDVTTL